MVQQKLLNDAEMDPIEQEVVRKEVLDFMRMHNAAEDPTYYPYGILRLTAWDDDGRPVRRKPKYWQVIAANHLLNKDAGKEFRKRKASLLAAHEMGTGKTITGILGLAGVHRLMSWWRASVAFRDASNQLVMPPEFKSVFIVPPSVLLKWEAEIQAWTTLEGKRLLVASKLDQLTQEAIDAARVIVVSPYVLMMALKTFAYDSENPDAVEEEGPSKKKRKSVRSSKYMADRIQFKKDAQGAINVHPIFKLVFTKGGAPLALVGIDELHTVYNPRTWSGYIVNLFAQRALHRFGFSGTPITSGPHQLAWAARALDARTPNAANPKELQDERFYGDGLVVVRESFEAWGKHLVDRVDARFLQDQITVRKKVTILRFDPFVGHLNRDGTVNREAIAAHNQQVTEIKNVVTAPGSKIKLKNGQEFTATIALGHYVFHPLLGQKGAEWFKKRDKPTSTPKWDEDKIRQAAEAPSQAMRLILRLIQTRQAAGHDRVAVFCESVSELKILMQYFKDLGDPVGDIFIYTGGQTAEEKSRKIKDFLRCPKGVFLFSAAGGIGIDLQKGCEVLLSVGSMPWNPADVDQAFARVYRIGQTKDVEIIQLVARRGVSDVIMGLHEDKRRLAAAAIDGDFEGFAGEDVEWRAQETIMSQCVTLDDSGNYVLTDAQRAQMDAYAAQARAARAAAWPVPTTGGVPLPPGGLSLPPEAAVPPSRMRLPRVAYPLMVTAA